MVVASDHPNHHQVLGSKDRHCQLGEAVRDLLPYQAALPKPLVYMDYVAFHMTGQTMGKPWSKMPPQKGPSTELVSLALVADCELN
jgi:hypothetical protein